MQKIESNHQETENQSMKNKTKKPKKMLTPEEKLQRIKLIIVAAFFILLLILLYEQMTSRAQIDQIAQKLESASDNLETFQVNQNNLISSLSKQINTATQEQTKVAKSVDQFLQNQIKIQSTLTQLQTQANQMQKDIQDQNAQFKTYLSNTNKKSTASNSVTLVNSDGNMSKYKKTTDYTIYGDASYGVILQDKNGNYIIAQINKELPIGMITSISRNEVIAGDYIITRK